MNDDPTVTLVERANRGDHSAWEHIVRRYAPLVWSVCWRFGISGADADDVGATVWLRLVTRLGTIREPGALPGWLATTTRNECRALLRRRNRECPVDDQQIAEPAPSLPERWIFQEERRIALRDAIARLPVRDQQLLSMLFADPPKSYAEISAALHMPIGAIGPTRRRCLERLRRFLLPPAPNGASWPAPTHPRYRTPATFARRPVAQRHRGLSAGPSTPQGGRGGS